MLVHLRGQCLFLANLFKYGPIGGGGAGIIDGLGMAPLTLGKMLLVQDWSIFYHQKIER
jgi:hypothetical protein